MNSEGAKPTPFERFQAAVKKVISAPKDEVDAEIAKRKASSSKEAVKPPAHSADK